jgi:hypothetical protein
MRKGSDNTFYINERVTVRGGRPIIKPVPFEGSLFNPFDQTTNIDWDHPMMKDIKVDDIVELGPTNVGGKIVMVPIKFRKDKNNPNGKEIALAVWDDIIKPLKIDTVKGKTFDLQRLYHNDVKRKLIAESSKIAGIQYEPDVLDIGFGRGGDIDKHKFLNKMFAVEPDQNNIDQWQERLERNHRKEKLSRDLKVFKAGGEDPRIVEEAIRFFGWSESSPSGRPFIITMMLSLSFFFGPEKYHEQLAKNINKLVTHAIKCGAISVKFVGMTIDGDLLRKTFGEKKILDLGSVNMEYNGRDKVVINFPGTILLENQVEYLVPLTMFIKSIGIEIKRKPLINICNDQRLLSKNEQIFTSMFKTFSVEYYRLKVVKEVFTLPTESGIFPNGDPGNSVFAAISKCLSGTYTGKQLRHGYLLWLFAESKYSVVDVLSQYDGLSPVPPEYASNMPINANYYTVKAYDDLLKNVDGEIKGIQYIRLLLENNDPLPHIVLTLIGLYLGVNIDIDIQGEITTISNYGNEIYQKRIKITTSDYKTYHSVGVKQRDGNINYMW